ncbi:MAG TPA: hypothetical protein VND64_12450 [Pirellulales bacterium]|nr:hypothetical protein [Pirellulales bacterium]
MPKYGYLVVEGPHDVEFSYRLLSTWLRGDALMLPRIAAVREFLRQLFELP